MADRSRWDLAAAVGSESVGVSRSRLVVEDLPVAVALVGLAVNLVLGSELLSVASVCCAAFGLAIRLARSGDDAAAVRWNVRTYLLGSFLFTVGMALASAYGAFISALPGLYLMWRAQSRARFREREATEV